MWYTRGDVVLQQKRWFLFRSVRVYVSWPQMPSKNPEINKHMAFYDRQKIFANFLSAYDLVKQNTWSRECRTGRGCVCPTSQEIILNTRHQGICQNMSLIEEHERVCNGQSVVVSKSSKCQDWLLQIQGKSKILFSWKKVVARG